MGLIIASTPFDGGPKTMAYIRLDGLHLDTRPEYAPSDGWIVPADRCIFVHLYGYADVAARRRGDPPVFDTRMTLTVAELGLAKDGETYAAIASLAPQEIWERIYALAKRSFRDPVDDWTTVLAQS